VLAACIALAAAVEAAPLAADTRAVVVNGTPTTPTGGQQPPLPPAAGAPANLTPVRPSDNSKSVEMLPLLVLLVSACISSPRSLSAAAAAPPPHAADDGSAQFPCSPSASSYTTSTRWRCSSAKTA